MARKSGRPKQKGGQPGGGGDNHTTLVRVASDVAADAKLISSFLQVTMVQYISETLRPIIKRELDDQMRRRLAEGESTQPDLGGGPE